MSAIVIDALSQDQLLLLPVPQNETARQFDGGAGQVSSWMINYPLYG